MANTYSQQTYDQQVALNKQGANLKTDGIMGPLTQAAIAKYPTKTDSTVITSDMLAPVKKLNLPGSNVTNPPTTGAEYSLPGATTPLQDEQSRVAKEKAASETGIQNAIAELAGVKAKEAGYITEAGGDEAQKLYNQYSVDLLAEQTASRKESERIRQNTLGGTEQSINSQINEAERKSLSKQADIVILGLGAKGQWDAALDKAKRKVDAELLPAQAKLDGLKFVFDNNKDYYSDVQKSKITEMLEKQKADIAEEKRVKTVIETLKVNALEAKAPSSVVAALAAIDSKDPKAYDKAIIAAAPYLTSLADKSKLSLETAQRAKIYADISRDDNTANLDPMNAYAYAAQYAETGKIPTGMPKGSFGTIAQYAKDLPKKKGALISSVTGITTDKIAAEDQKDISSLYNITQNIKKLKALDDKRVGGLLSGSVGFVFGSEDQGEYLGLRQTIVDDISRMQSGAALTPGEVKFYENYLPGRFSETGFLGQGSDKKIANFETFMNDRLANVLSTNQLSVVGYSPVTVEGQQYIVGDIITNANNQQARVNSDGSLTAIESSITNNDGNAIEVK